MLFIKFFLKVTHILQALQGQSGNAEQIAAAIGAQDKAEDVFHILRHLAANELRGHLGVVPQETILFSGTLYDNLLAAAPHAKF